MQKSTYKSYLSNILPCVGYGILSGTVTGTLIFFFKLAAQKLTRLSGNIYALAKTSPLGIVLLFAGLGLAAALMVLLHRKIPETKGGGIPRSEGILRGVLSIKPLRTLLGTALGSMLSFFCGLPLGSEGPAVLIGTSAGSLCLFGNKSAWNRYVMSGGAGAGFAVATGAPLSAVLFVLEEIHKRFTPMLVLTVSMSVLSATYVNRLLCGAFGLSPELFSTDPIASFELSHLGYLLLFGILVAAAVGLFDASVAQFGKLMKPFGHILTGPVKIGIVFALTGILGLCMTDGLYSGHDVILELVTEARPAAMTAAILLVRWFMMLLVTDSGVTGGIFIPTLAVGALVSSLAAKLMLMIGMPEELFSAVVLLGMCAFTGGTLRAPLTAAVLFLECTGQFTDLFYVVLVVFIVNFFTELIHAEPFYDRVLEELIHAQNHGKTARVACFEMQVYQGAFAVGKAVRDIMWPTSAVVLSVTHAEGDHEDTANDGEKILLAEDTVVVRARFYEETEILDSLRGLVGEDAVIREIQI